MSKLLEAYTTKQDTVFKKVEGSDGKTYHFKDGTPVTENSFNGGQSQIKYKGQPAKVAVPSDNGPGYERKEVSQTEASSLGEELKAFKDGRTGEMSGTVTLDGEQYDSGELIELNEELTERYPDSNDIVIRY
jgi:hypothetical protein